MTKHGRLARCRLVGDLLLLLLGGWAFPVTAQGPVITEFMAVNNGPLLDEDGASSDWIEIFNPGSTDINLGGWFLTDIPTNLTRWAFPAINVGARQFLVAFASGKNRTNTARPLHTNFKLDAAGDYLALVRPDGRTVSQEFSPAYPSQVAFVSYGFAMAGLEVASLTAGFLTPSPGLGNGAFLGFGPGIKNGGHWPEAPAATDVISVRAQVLPNGISIQDVTLSYRVMFGPTVTVPMADDGLNGDDAAADGIFEGAIPGGVAKPGEMIRWSIRAVDSAGNQTRLPTFRDPNRSPEYFGAVVTDSTLITELPVLDLFITPSNLNDANNSGNVHASCAISYLGEFYDNVRINRHGEASGGFPKKSYDLSFSSEHLFRWSVQGARVRDVDLLSTYPDKSYLRNLLAYEYTYRPAGLPSHFVEPIRIQINAGFYGVWHLVESEGADFLQRNGRDPQGALYRMHNTFTSIENTTIGGERNAEKLTRLDEGNDDLVALFTGIVGTGSPPDRIRYLYDHVDIAQMLNSLAARVITSDVDCCHQNYSLYRDTDGTGEWQTFPWDVDLSFGRNWNSTLSYWDDFVYPQNPLWIGANNGLFQVLFNNHPGGGINPTRQMYLRRVRTLMDQLQQPTGTPSTRLHYENAIDLWAKRIARDAALDLAKWGTWGNGMVGIFDPSNPHYRTLADSVAELKTNYMVNRRRFVFDQKMRLPLEFPDAQPNDVVIQFGDLDYNPISGNQSEEYIQLVNPYNFAVDISGWRLSGAVEHTFQGGVVIPPGLPPTNTLYVVRNKRAFRSRTTGPRAGQGLYIEGNYRGQLSARGEVITLINADGRVVATNAYEGTPTQAQQFLRVDEIHYHPGRGPGDDRYLPFQFSFIELLNIGPEAIDLSRVKVAGSIAFSFTSNAAATLAPGERLVLAKNREAFGRRYGTGVLVAGEFTGTLEQTEGQVRIEDSGENVLDLVYRPGWYPLTDGAGFSLVAVNPGLPNVSTNWQSSGAWRTSGVEQGTPGQPDPGPLVTGFPAVVVNEVLPNSEQPYEDAIEFYNPGPMPADISYPYLTDDRTRPRKFQFPPGTVIAPWDYLAIDEHTFNSRSATSGLGLFALGAEGDEVQLLSADVTGRLTGYVHGFEFGSAARNTSFGRHVDSRGRDHFVAQLGRTLGLANAGPKIGPVVISEIHYRPVRLSAGENNTRDEFVELANISNAPVPLFDAAHPANTWRFRGGVDFDFPTNAILPPNGYALLVSFSTVETRALAAFRARFNVPFSVPIFGPYEGQLSNDGEDLRLLKPGEPISEKVPYIVVDEVEYENGLPWPKTLIALGATLQRIDATAFGNDPSNWRTAGPTPGRSLVQGGIPPTILTNPVSFVGAIGQAGALSIVAMGTPPLFYQWYFYETSIDGANSPTLTFPALKIQDKGPYSCSILNPAGALRSTNALVTVLELPAITMQPSNALVRIRPDPLAAPVTNATFRISAATEYPPLTYQWRYNDAAILGATNNSLTITNVSLAQEGMYACAVSDAYFTVVSQAARLAPLVGLRWRFTPIDQRVVTGATVTVSAEITGHPLPIEFEWRLSSTPVATRRVERRFDQWSFTAPVGLSADNYRVVARNLANAVPGIASPPFTITTLLDSDSDGLPDEFEVANGLDPTKVSDAALDTDGDGMSNGAEYIAGTDLRDPLSYLRIEPPAFARSGQGPTVTFLATSNRTYSVEARNSIAAGQWQTIAGVVASPTNRWVTVVDDGTSGEISEERVYRLVTPGQQTQEQ